MPSRHLRAVCLGFLVVLGHASPASFAGVFAWNSIDDVATEMVTLTEQHEVGGLEFSPDGEQLVVMAGAYDRTAHVYDWKKSKIKQTLEEAYAEPLATTPARFSPDGRYFARCGNPIRVWDAATWNVTASFRTGSGPCSSLEFSSDGKFMFVAAHGAPDRPSENVIVYEVETWRKLWGLNTTPFYIQSISLSPDGRAIALGGHVSNVKSWRDENFVPPKFGDPPYPDTGLIAVVDIPTRSIARTIPVAEADYSSGQGVSWSSDGKTIAFGATDGIRHYSATTGEFVAIDSKGQNYSKVTGKYTPDGKYLIVTGFGEKGRKIRVLDATRRDVLQEISAITSSLAISRDGRYVAICGSAPSPFNIDPILALLFPAKGRVIVYKLK